MSFYDADGMLLDLNKSMCTLCDFNATREAFFRKTCMFDVPMLKNDFDRNSKQVFHVCQHMLYPEIGIDKLSADGTIHLKLEWLPHNGDPTAKNGRAIGTGPYVAKFIFHTKEVAIAPTANKKHRAGTVKKQNKEKRVSMGYRRIK